MKAVHELNMLSTKMFRAIVTGALSASVVNKAHKVKVGDGIVYREQIAMYPQIGLYDVRQRYMPSRHIARVTVTSVTVIDDPDPHMRNYSLIGFKFEEEALERRKV